MSFAPSWKATEKFLLCYLFYTSNPTTTVSSHLSFLLSFYLLKDSPHSYITVILGIIISSCPKISSGQHYTPWSRHKNTVQTHKNATDSCRLIHQVELKMTKAGSMTKFNNANGYPGHREPPHSCGPDTKRLCLATPLPAPVPHPCVLGILGNSHAGLGFHPRKVPVCFASEIGIQRPMPS